MHLNMFFFYICVYYIKISRILSPNNTLNLHLTMRLAIDIGIIFLQLNLKVFDKYFLIIFSLTFQLFTD